MLTFSPDGRRLGVCSGTCGWLVNAATGKCDIFFDPPHSPRQVVFSADLRKLLSLHEDGLRVWETDKGKLLLHVPGGPSIMDRIAFSPDGRVILRLHWELGVVSKTLMRWETDTGRELPLLAAGDYGPSSFTVTPDSKMILGSGQDQLWLCDMATGRQVRRVASDTGLLHLLVCSPDGRWVAASELPTGFVAGDYRPIRVWDLAAGRELCSFHGHTDTVGGLAVSPDRRFVASSGDQTLRVWRVPG